MLVKMLRSMSGPGILWQAGSEQEIGDAEAKRLISAGFAAPVRGPKVERAVAPEAEKAVTRKAPAKKAAKKKVKK